MLLCLQASWGNRMSPLIGKGVVSLFFSSAPYCVGVVQPDLLVLMGLRYVTVGANVGDLIAILGSIDFVLGSVDL